MGVKLREGGFQSHHAAELAGRQALEDFLNGLSMEGGQLAALDLTFDPDPTG
jgi:hypothetical protein